MLRFLVVAVVAVVVLGFCVACGFFLVAELVSNAWDADANNVYINFKNEGEKTITVSDDGIGMTFSELNDYFLKIGRNRRVEMHKDETDGGRKVLGKKGLGKLSMFGIGKVYSRL